ncbi:MAG: hypothetical protein LBB83_01890, partial [Treponema sp.]|nr:hypothetical protein [Treponema sp.]
AVAHCVENNILRDFFEANASEVVNMLLTEWNTVDYGEVQREEGREEGQHMVLELVKQGYTAEEIEAKLSEAPQAGNNYTS